MQVIPRFNFLADSAKYFAALREIFQMVHAKFAEKK
jgi:hypothetical protein